MARVPIYVFATIVLTACGASSSPVRGPDGDDAHLISCGNAGACYEKAAQVCGGDYVILESHGTADHIRSHEILVSCKADMPPSADTTSAAASSDREDSHVCQAASKFREAFGTYWASSSGGILLDEPPAPRDFIVTCRSMPETVQRCMHEKYRSAHHQACAAFFVRLDIESKMRIDALYLRAPAEPKPRETAPGTSI